MESAVLVHVLRAESALGLLQGQQRLHANELVEVSRQLFSSGAQVTEQDRARIGHLVELLARREAVAMPYAAFGRALLAHISGAHQQRDALFQEFSTKLDLLGM
jgi:hypothetical protein